MSVSGNQPLSIDVELVQITTDTGSLILPAGDRPEPEPASVVLTHGNYGNAWQRHGNDGLWHSTTGAKRRWSQMLRMRGLVLIYDAPEREVEPPKYEAPQRQPIEVHTWATGRGN